MKHEWHCFKCKEKVIEEEVELEYLGITFTEKIIALKCPKCKAIYILEDAAKKVKMGEELIETKAI